MQLSPCTTIHHFISPFSLLLSKSQRSTEVIKEFKGALFPQKSKTVRELKHQKSIFDKQTLKNEREILRYPRHPPPPPLGDTCKNLKVRT